MKEGKKNKIVVENLSLRYGEQVALNHISLSIPEQAVTAIIGPSGCGKSTFLRTLNRMNDNIAHCYCDGKIMMDGANILDQKVDVVDLRCRVGMVFQIPNPFPSSIYANVAFAPKLHGIARRGKDLDAIVEKSLINVGLWNEVKDRLKDSPSSLSGGQQQRLCIARAIAINPEVILMDEPCSALDPIATARIENLISQLREKYTVVIVTHSMQQAARVSQRTAFFHLGELIETGETGVIFTQPKQSKTQDYITGRFG